MDEVIAENIEEDREFLARLQHTGRTETNHHTTE